MIKVLLLWNLVLVDISQTEIKDTNNKNNNSRALLMIIDSFFLRIFTIYT